MYSSISLLPRSGENKARRIPASYQKASDRKGGELDFCKKSTAEGEAKTGIDNFYLSGE